MLNLESTRQKRCQEFGIIKDPRDVLFINKSYFKSSLMRLSRAPH